MTKTVEQIRSQAFEGAANGRFFVDCEFDGHNGGLLSIAMVREGGRSIHIRTIDGQATDPWVIENIVPLLDEHEAEIDTSTFTDNVGSVLRRFIGDCTSPVIIADSPVDIGRFCTAISTGPDGGWASTEYPRMTFVVHNVDCYPTDLPGAVQHNAYWDAMALRHKLANPIDQHPTGEQETFQARVDEWLLGCFGEEIARDPVERNHRFLEEALELAQACGCSASEAHQLVDYTFPRPVGEKGQEVGGVMNTLAALCLAHSLDMMAEGNREMDRVSNPETMAKIRAKQAAKPKHSPLPAHPTGEADTSVGRDVEADLRIGLWNALRSCGVAQDACYPIINAAVKELLPQLASPHSSSVQPTQGSAASVEKMARELLAPELSNALGRALLEGRPVGHLSIDIATAARALSTALSSSRESALREAANIARSFVHRDRDSYGPVSISEAIERMIPQEEGRGR